MGLAERSSEYTIQLTSIPRCGIYHPVVYIESAIFHEATARVAGAASLDVLSLIQADLLDNSVRGDLVQGLGGIRKARCSNPIRGKGKRGGYRFLYLYLESRHHIHLLYLL